MKRRDFLSLSALTTGGLLLSTQTSADTVDARNKPSGAVTLYYEFRVPNPEKAIVLGKIDQLIALMKTKTGFLNLSLKQMTGESTMVKNYPNNLKGVLDRGFADQNGNPTSLKVPNFYTLFIRFADYDSLIASEGQKWFKENIKPSLYAYKPTTPPTKTAIELDFYEGIYTTVAAGDRNAIHTTPESIHSFLETKRDEITNRYVTVENHVMIDNRHLEDFNKKVSILLTTAQQTFRPDVKDSDYNSSFPNGEAGSSTNTYYRKAVTTEILQNAFADGELRSYIMHGVWESMYDHENSHIDPRFLQSAGPVGAYVVVGPVEPFYDTIKQA
jgi:hypothetical protein